MKSYKLGVAVVAGLLLLGAVSVPAGAAAAAPLPPGRRQTVTLVTGDRVTVAGGTAASIEPGPGRERIPFVTSLVNGHLLVIPADAARLIQTRRVDRRLFDLTELLTAGARTGTPLLVRYRSAGDAVRTQRAATIAGARVTRDLPAIRGAALTADSGDAGRVWASLTAADSGAEHIWLDGVRTPSLDVSVPQIGAPAAWRAGLTGAGMSVAVLDTGVDDTHPDLKGRITAQDFTGTGPADEVGHGTHVASIIAGDGTASGGRYKGVAPDARVLSGKVCTLEGCPDSAILAAMQWAAADQGARVINMSLGGPDFDGVDPLEEAVRGLSAQTGALFVIAAGNSGPDAGSVESPGVADAALSVGAVDADGVTASFSSRGPRTADGAIKPDIAAPGVRIAAARAAGTEMDTPDPAYPDAYVRSSGTSMATPHVAGAAVLLAQKRHDWRGPQLKAALMGSAHAVAGVSVFEQGAGRADVARAIEQTVVADPPSLSLGVARWPHPDVVTMNRTLTYRNDGASAIGLTLTVEEPFALSTSTLDIPAGEERSVIVSARLTTDSVYSGRVVATGGGQSVVTSVAAEKEPERYSVTLRHLGLDGKPVRDYLTQLWGLGDGQDDLFLPWDPSGTVTLRLPKGRYTTATSIDSPPGTAVVYLPVFEVTGDVTIEFDARRTTPVAQHVPDPAAVATSASVGVDMVVDGERIAYGQGQETFAGLRIGQLGGRVPVTGSVSSGWQSPDEMSAYFVSERVPGERLLAGYDRRFFAGELAAEKQIVHGPPVTERGAQWLEAIGPDGELVDAVRVPLRNQSRTNYYSTSPGLRWAATTGVNYTDFFAQPRAYRAGSKGTREWGGAPLTPVLRDVQTRDGAIGVFVGQFGDAAGHVGVGWDTPTRTALYSDGVLIGENDGHFAVGVGSGPYRLTQTGSGGYNGYATSTSTELAFRTRPISIHLGRETSHGIIPVTVRDSAGRDVRASRLTLAVSYDDGRTWRAAEIRGDGEAGTVAVVHHPKGAGFVSVRTSAAAGDASTTNTVLRSYRVGAPLPVS